MRNLVCLLMFLLALNVFAQSPLEQQKDTSKVKQNSFLIKESAPTYPGCAGNTREKMQCLAKNLQVVFVKKFDVDRAKCMEFKKPKRKGKKRKCLKSVPEKRLLVKTTFAIDTTGYLVDIQPNTIYNSVNEEVIRALKQVPYIEPGVQKGKKVKVKMSFPIRLRL